MGGYHGFIQGTQYNHKGPSKRKQENQRQKSRCDDKSRGGAVAKECRQPLGAQKGKKVDSSLEPLERMQLCCPISDFRSLRL